MSNLTVSGISLRGIAAAVPKEKEDNAELETLSEKAKTEIIERVGIRYRHVAPETITASDLCLESAQHLLKELGWHPNEIGLLIFVTQTPDYTVPGTATQLQETLGLPTNAMALDINQGCAGYVYGMSVISGLMKSFGIQKSLLLVGDTITKMISKEDNSIRPIFADAGTATAFELDFEAEEMTFKLGSDGSAFEAIHIPSGGYRNPVSQVNLEANEIAPGIIRSNCQLAMNGQAVFTFGLSIVAKQINELLTETKKSANDFDYLVLHQANQFLNDAIARKCGFPSEKVPSSLKEFGNTSCATIPVTLVSQLSGEIKNKELKLLLCGFGVGLSWGNVILTTRNLVCPEVIYV